MITLKEASSANTDPTDSSHSATFVVTEVILIVEPVLLVTMAVFIVGRAFTACCVTFPQPSFFSSIFVDGEALIVNFSVESSKLPLTEPPAFVFVLFVLHDHEKPLAPVLPDPLVAAVVVSIINNAAINHTKIRIKPDRSNLLLIFFFSIPYLLITLTVQR